MVAVPSLRTLSFLRMGAILIYENYASEFNLKGGIIFGITFLIKSTRWLILILLNICGPS